MKHAYATEQNNKNNKWNLTYTKPLPFKTGDITSRD